MITELSTQEKVIGVKQSRKAIRDGRAKRVFLACDADPAITGPVAETCAAAGIPVEEGHTMAQLGQACRITVGAAVVAVLYFGFFGIALPLSAKNKCCPRKRPAKI